MNALTHGFLIAVSVVCMVSASAIWASDPGDLVKIVATAATLYCAITAANKAMKDMG